MDLDTALKRIAQTHQNLLSALEGMSEGEITHTPVEGSWTSKDLIAHLSSWEELCLGPISSLAAGQEVVVPEIPDHLAWNDQAYARWRELSLAEIRAESERVRAELISLVRQVPLSLHEQLLPVPWGGTATVGGIISGLAWHEKEHLSSIRKYRGAEANPD